MNTIDILFTPDLLPYYVAEGKVCVVIDIFRASTTMVTALANGARVLYPLESLEAACTHAAQGALVGAERNVVRCDFARFGNDPAEYTPATVSDQEIYFTTTNGTRTIIRCMERTSDVVVGAFINLAAIASYCKGRDVLCVCAGWQGQYCLEDSLFAGALTDQLRTTHIPTSDAARLMQEVWIRHRSDLADYLRQSDHYGRLLAAGKAHAVDYCLQLSLYDIVPIVTITSDGNLACSTRHI